MVGGDGCRGPFWRYWEDAEETGSTVSSCAGTIVSTAHTSNLSRPSALSMGASPLDIHGDEDVSWEETVEEEKKERNQMKRMKSLVLEFFGLPGGDMSVLARWLTELGVGWILYVADGASDKIDQGLDPRSWMRALAEIMRCVRFTASLFPDPSSVGLPSICEEGEEGDEAPSSIILDQFQYAWFIQETMLKMLTFVDFIAALDPIGVRALYQKMNILLGVQDALSKALTEIRLLYLSQVGRVQGMTVNLLSAKEAKAREALWGAMEQIPTRVLELMRDGLMSSDIHRATHTLVGHIIFLRYHYSSLAPIVSEAASLGKYVPRITQASPLISLVMELASCLEEKLAQKSRKLVGVFADADAHTFLFLLNNSYLIWEQLEYSLCCLGFRMPAFRCKVELYMERYLDVSWAPVLSCLFDPVPLCLFGNNSPLSNFEFEFQETYSTQKLWKVPDPKLRKTLRAAIIQKIIPGYTKYIKDNKVATLKFTPQNLAEMLQEIFEG